jgi:hypothetical protein
MTGFDVIQVTTLSEEILSLIVWVSALGGSGLAVLVMAKWWGPQHGDEVAKAVSAARRKARAVGGGERATEVSD